MLESKPDSGRFLPIYHRQLWCGGQEVRDCIRRNLNDFFHSLSNGILPVRNYKPGGVAFFKACLRMRMSWP